MCARFTPSPRSWSSARGAAKVRRSCWCRTYRFTGHHVGDINREYYRSKQEEQNWKTERDPIKLFTDWLLEQKLADRAGLDQIQAEVKAEIENGGAVRAGGAVSERG